MTDEEKQQKILADAQALAGHYLGLPHDDAIEKMTNRISHGDPVISQQLIGQYISKPHPEAVQELSLIIAKAQAHE